MNILIIGGDQRNVHLQTVLTQAGHTVTDFALGGKAVSPDYRQFRWIVGPIPFTDDGRHLHAPLHREKIAIADFLESLPETATLFAGTIPAGFAIHCRHVDLTHNTDLYNRNLVPTAEGVIQILLNQIDFTLAGSSILVAGYGKVGKTVARLLAALGANVSIYSTAPLEQNEISACYTSVSLGDLSPFQIVVNTIPAVVFDARNLSTLQKEALLLDVASFPGGVDAKLAAKTCSRLVRAYGIPGKKAPRTVAESMRDIIVEYIETER